MNDKSFTLIEIMVVIVIIGIISSFIYPSTTRVRNQTSLTKIQLFSQKLNNSLAENIIGQWLFNEKSGAVVYDNSGNGNNGTIYGNAAWETSSKNCVFDFCLNFDGVDDYVGVSNDLTNGLTSLTAGVWVKGSRASNILCSANNAIILHFRGAGFYLVAEDGTASNYLSWSTTLPYNEWLYLVATWSSPAVGGDGKMKLYVNGVKESGELAFAGGTTGRLKSGNPLNIGKYFNDSQPWFLGKMDDISIYDKVSSVSQIRQNYYLGLNNLFINREISKVEYQQRIAAIERFIANGE